MIGRFSMLTPTTKSITNSKYRRLIQDSRAPFYYVTSNNCIIAPPHRMKTDGGSIPPIFQWGKLDGDYYLPSYLCHDHLFFCKEILRRRRDGPLTDSERHCLVEGIFEPNEAMRRYIFAQEFDIEPMQLTRANNYLWEMIETQEPVGSLIPRCLIRAGVFIGSWVCWLRYSRIANESDDGPPTDYEVDGLTRGWIKRGKMYLAHNITEGKNSAARAVDKTAGNVTYFHTHSFDQSPRVFPSVGLVMAFSPGCLCEMQPMWKHSDPSGWNQGYDIDFITATGNFQRVHIPIWKGTSLACMMIERLKS